jgi:TolB-like protein/Tfp pilus assembly protein PilF/tRNA A-37 threonylcarbamoyl transferase component Bud32
VTDLPPRLVAALADRYRIERELGQGGMATVYVAEDLRHQRKVAIKVLRPELAQVLGGDRFQREITIAARLQHPHILPVFDSGAADGMLWYSMPLVEGESLRDLLARELQLPVETTVRITREVADALDYAHAQGVIHRDIKPENILLSRGHALVADFGIARAVNERAGRLTATGLAIGTPAYMSPEQAGGEREVDGRSDEYSLACVAYEMLAGEPPYTGPTAHAIMAKRLTDPVPSARRLRQAIPSGLDQAIMRGLAPTPADRFQSSGEFARALEGDVDREAAPWRIRSSRVAAGALAALVVAVLAILVARTGPSAAEERTLAVLPFRNLGTAADQYFADGLTEEITGRLGRIAGLTVRPRSRAAQYADTAALAAVGKALEAGYLIVGSVRWDRAANGPSRIRVTPRLIRTRDERQLWNESFDADLADIFQVQSRIAEQIAEALGIALDAGEKERLATRPTGDLLAHDHVLKGNFLLAKRTPEAVEKAIAEYEAALQLDPGYTSALARVGYAYTLFVDWGWRYGRHSISDLRARALEFAGQALAADSNSAEAWLTRAYVLTQEDPYHMRDAVPAFERALALDSTTAEGWYQYGQTLMALGRDSAASAAYRRAFRLDPNRPMALMSLSAIELRAGRIKEARRLIDTAILASRTVTSPYVRVVRGLIELADSDVRAARDDGELALALDTSYAVPAHSLLAQVYAVQGETAKARLEIGKALAKINRAEPSPTDAKFVAGGLLGLGQRDAALDLLERVRPRGAYLWFYLRSLEFTPLHGDPRFQRLMADANPNLPDR